MLVMPKVLLYGERLLPLLFVFVLLILVGFAYKGVFKLLLYKVGCDHFSNKLVGVS